MKKRLLLSSMIWAISLVVGLTILVGYAGAQSKGPIKIGILNPYTGHSALHGTNFEKGVKLYLKQIGYKTEGRTIEIYTEDTEGKPEVGLVKAKRLVEAKGVHILTGVTMSNVGYALKPYAEKAKIPYLVATFCGGEELTHPPVSPYLFRTSVSSCQLLPLSADWGYKKKGWRKATLFSLDYVAGVDYSGTFSRHFKKLGGTIAQELYGPFGTTDWSPYIAKIDKTVDAIAGILIGGECIKFLKQWREYGLQGKIAHALDGFEDNDLEAAGDDSLGVINVRPWAVALETPTNKAFVKAYFAEYGTPPYAASERGYTAMQLISTVLRTDTVKGNIENKEAFIKAMAEIDIRDTPRGRIRFDKYHHVIQDFYILKARETPKDLVATWGKYSWEIMDTYKDVDQFWPYTAEEYLAMPKLGTLRGTWAK